MLLPKFVGQRSDLLLKPPCSKAPLQLPPQFVNEPPEALRCCLVADVGSEPPCSFDLPLEFANIFTLIHWASPIAEHEIAQSSSKPPIIWRSAWCSGPALPLRRKSPSSTGVSLPPDDSFARWRTNTWSPSRHKNHRSPFALMQISRSLLIMFGATIPKNSNRTGKCSFPNRPLLREGPAGGWRQPDRPFWRVSTSLV
jgi:hypothetical protein